MEQESSNQMILRMFEENKKTEDDLKAKMHNLEVLCKNLEKEKPVTVIARQKLEKDKKEIYAKKYALHLAFQEHMLSCDSMLGLMEEQKREKEECLNDILDLEKESIYKLEVEMEIEMLKSKLNLVEFVEDEDDEDVKNQKIMEINEEIKEKSCELEEIKSGRVVRNCLEEFSSGYWESD